MKTWNVNSRVEKGYPWLAFPQSESSRKAIIALLVAIVIGVLFTVGYLKTGLDPSPDSIVGYSYAFIGTGFALAALIAYTRKRRSHRRSVGQLNGALNWHTVFGLLALF